MSHYYEDWSIFFPVQHNIFYNEAFLLSLPAAKKNYGNFITYDR